MANKPTVNWEKIGIYVAMLMAFLAIINHIIDLKERVSKIEVKIEQIEG